MSTPASSPGAASKKRLRTAGTREAIVQQYKDALAPVLVVRDTVFQPWYAEDVQVYACMATPEVLPPGFAKTADDKYQYSFTFEAKRYRPVAYRVPFLMHPEFENPGFTVSHLCHNNWCYNWDHHVLELLAVNKARNGCPGGPHCHHKVKCLIPGQYFDA